MGEIDTKPIESVQTALSLFGEKGDHHRKNYFTGVSDDEKERELENVLKDLANYKLQLEAKEAAYMQVLLKLEQSQKSVGELSNQLKNSEVERERNMDERERTNMQLSSVLLELQAKEAELASLRESESNKMLERAGILERDLEMEREKCEELEKRVCERDVEVALAKEGLLATQEMIEKMRREVERVMELENEVLSKTILVDLIVMQLKEVDEELISSKLLQEELEIMIRKNYSQEALIEAFKMDAKEKKTELKNANQLGTHLKANIETLSSDLEKARAEIYTMRENEKEKEVDFGGNDAMKDEIERLRKELEEAMAKVAELRNRAEQATCRAEVVERAKAAIEGQLRKWRDDRRMKRITQREEFESMKIEISTEEKPQPTVHYQPLYKVLNMKFK